MKRLRFISIMFLIVSLLLTGCNVDTPLDVDRLVSENLVVGDLNGIDESKLTLYTIDVDLDTGKMSYKGMQSVNYVNSTDIELEEIYFHIYPNAFKDVSTLPVLFDTGNRINHDQYVPGYIDMEMVSSHKKDLNWNVEGDKDTILHVELDKPLKRGESIQLYLEYEVKIPTTEDRFGYHDKGINLGNWYPIVAVYDDDGWNLDPYNQVGDPFYSEVSNYKLNITVPKKLKIATSGKIISETIYEDKRIYEIGAQLMRDVAWAVSENFRVKERLVDDTVVRVYSTDRNKGIIEDALDTGEKALRTFNKVFGKYPYGQYSIVITKFPSGMEYPGIVFISDEYGSTGRTGRLEIVIVHETAHQWWYGLVGNDQINEAWLDESLATYSEVIYLKETYGEEKGEAKYNDIKFAYERAAEYIGKNEVVNKPLSQFDSWSDYGTLVYDRGAMLLGRIKEDFGEEILYDILNEYYSRYKFCVAKTEDFIDVCEDITGASFDDLVNEYLNGNPQANK